MHLAGRMYAMHVAMHSNTLGPANRGLIELELVEDDLVPQITHHRRGIAKLDLLSDTCTSGDERWVSHVYTIYAYGSFAFVPHGKGVF